MFLLCDAARLEVCTHLPDLLRLREASDCGGGELGNLHGWQTLVQFRFATPHVVLSLAVHRGQVRFDVVGTCHADTFVTQS